ncbi:unnamed protein product [Adineta ricciae]|uniref:SAM domain-containing protein n=1 Tax=Adineta ricciae TaxID=249248 RepID=A0A814CVP9_ADIRI|nr:unnamed protein product [Adineta ricciae]CAF1260934.1 unnamed protein product [Adineta ricciae]
MANWTLEEVLEWLETNGFEQYTQIFIDEDIDGAALLGLCEDDIVKLLATVDENGKRRNATLRTRRKFLAKLEECKSLANEKQRIQNNGRLNGILHTTTDNKEHSSFPQFTGKTTDDSRSYSKLLIVDSASATMKFFRSELICDYLTNYLSTTFDVKCDIPIITLPISTNDLSVRLFGMRQNVLTAYSNLRSLFTTICTRVFNEENTNPKVTKWSKNIYCDSVVVVLQKIFLDKRILTVWEKTSLLSGYYIVYYLSGSQEASVIEKSIDHALNHEISFVKDIIVSNVRGKYQSELNEFISSWKNEQRKSQPLTIISYQSPFQTDMKISLFGIKETVHVAKKQLKLLVHKHQTKTTVLNLDSKQREYLLNNCTSSLKQIELNYEEDNVKIQIREGSFVSPQYLVKSIKQLIQSMIFQTVNLTFKSLENVFHLTDQNRLQLHGLAKNHNCEIDNILVDAQEELISLPKGKIPTRSGKPTQSCSPLFVPRVISIANKTLEIQRPDRFKADVIIISTEEDCVQNKIEPKGQHGYFQTNTGQKLLYLSWSLSQIKHYNNQSESLLKESIGTFISLSLRRLDQYYGDSVRVIAYSTNKWENIPQRKQFVQVFIDEMKSQLANVEFKNCYWRIVFSLGENQRILLKTFADVMSNSQTQDESDEQFSCPISTSIISLKTSSDNNISQCQKAINDYIEKNIFIAVKINKPFDESVWNQHMINDYYNYCLQESILPSLLQTGSSSYLELSGPIRKVDLAKEKYELMSKIAYLKVIPTNLVAAKMTRKPFEEKSKQGNIFLSFCSADGILPDILNSRLIDEDYVVLVDASDHTSSSFAAKMERADVVVICFTVNYYKNMHCRNVLRTAKESLNKTIVPVVLIPKSSNQENNWMRWIETEELYYEVFADEIRFKLNEDFDLNYEKLLAELLRYTKPGAFGQTYPQLNDVSIEESSQDGNVNHRQDSRVQLTTAEVQEKQRNYEKYIEEIIRNQRISDDTVENLIYILKIILKKPISRSNSEDLEEEEEESARTSEDEKTSDQSSSNSTVGDIQNQSTHLQSFLSLIKRWITKASNEPVILGNIPPFTLTGDYNDAEFPIPLRDKRPWWELKDLGEHFQHSRPDELKLFSEPIIVGSWFSSDEAHEYFESISGIEIHLRRQKKKVSEGSGTGEHPHKNDAVKANSSGKYMKFDTSIKDHVSVWDTKPRDIDFLKEYKIRTKGWTTKLPADIEERWNHYWPEYHACIQKLVWGKVEAQSLQGAALRRREILNDPGHRVWRDGTRNRGCPQFVKQMIRNAKKWEKFLKSQQDQ